MKHKNSANPFLRKLVSHRKVPKLRCAILIALCVLTTTATSSWAQSTYSYAGTNYYWGTNANWSPTPPPNGASQSAIMATTGVMENRVLLADSSGNNASFTVGSFTFGTGGGATGQIYRVSNLTGGTTTLTFEKSDSSNAGLLFKEIYADTTMKIDTGVILKSNLNINVERTLGGTYQINGAISSGTAGTGIYLNGNGTLEIGGVNTYSGETFIGSGTRLTTRLRLINGSDRLPVGTKLTVNASRTLDLNNFNQTVGQLAGGGYVTNNATAAGTSTLTISSTTNSSVFSGRIQNGSNATTALTKNGSGTTLTLAGSNTYTGATAVNSGTLLVTGSIANTTVTVNSGGVLGGNGSAAGAVSVASGGILAPGTASIGNFSVGNTSFASGAKFSLRVNTDMGTIDRLSITGNLSLASGSELSLLDIGSNATLNATLTIASYTGTWNGGYFTYNATVLNNGATFAYGANNYTIDYSTGNAVTLAVAAIPEPAVVGLIALALGGLLAARRRVIRQD